MKPSHKIESQSWMTDAAAYMIIKLLSGHNNAMFVGGCVRDAIVGKVIKDIDIATTHLPEGVMHILQSKGIMVIPTGIKHGTVTAIIEGKHFEITTLRRDVACFGRHAEVEYTDNWHEDASRRDFTINAMFMDINGNVYDYFGGVDDLRNGVVRFVGDAQKRIQEDYLRILRLFRFFAYYGKGSIIEEHLKAVSNNVTGLRQISGERIQAEMLKILTSPDPSYVIEEMNKTGVLREILPGGIRLSSDMLKPLIKIEKDENLPFRDGYIRLAAMINFSTREQISELCNKWKLSNRDRYYLMILVGHDPNMEGEMAEAEQKKAIRNIGKDSFIAKILVKWARDKEGRSYSKAIKLAENWEIPEFPLSGEDILDMGVKPGKQIGSMLREAEEYWEMKNYKPGRTELLKYLGNKTS